MRTVLERPFCFKCLYDGQDNDVVVCEECWKGHVASNVSILNAMVRTTHRTAVIPARAMPANFRKSSEDIKVMHEELIGK